MPDMQTTKPDLSSVVLNLKGLGHLEKNRYTFDLIDGRNFGYM